MSQNTKDIGLLVGRIIIGAIFIYSGWIKVSDMATTIGFFGQVGLAPFWAYLVSYVELIGGIMLLLGLFTCIAAMPLGIIMIVAIYLTRGMGVQAFGFPLAVLSSLIILATSCGGKYSVKRCFCKNKSEIPQEAKM